MLTGSWSDEPCVFTGSAGRMPADQSWPGNAQPEGRRKNTPLQKQPPASRNRLVGVLKLSGHVECNFQPDFRDCLAQDPRKFRESRRTSPPVTGHEANGSSRVQVNGCELELRKRASRATLELNSKGCDFRAGAAETYCVYYFCIRKL